MATQVSAVSNSVRARTCTPMPQVGLTGCQDVWKEWSAEVLNGLSGGEYRAHYTTILLQ